MGKSEIYSWRVSPELKATLEEAARAEGASVSRLLDRIVSQWLSRHGAGGDAQEAERRIRAAAAAAFGVIRGGQPDRSATVRERVRARLAERHARR